MVAFLLSLALSVVPLRAPLTVRDLDGRAWMPLSPMGSATHVVIFVTPDCPNSNAYAPEIARIAGEYADRRVRTFLVYVKPGLTGASAREHQQTYHSAFKGAAIVEQGFKLAAAAGVTVTPEVAVYTPKGRVYRGRIDDRFTGLGQPRRDPQQRDLRQALDAVLAGWPVPVAETTAVGCLIEKPSGGLALRTAVSR